MAGRRLIKRFTNGLHAVKVYFDYSQEEFQAEYHIDGQRQEALTYYTTDEDDALRTAQRMLFDYIAPITVNSYNS